MSASNLKSQFEQMAKPKAEPEIYRQGKKPKPVGQREWTPTPKTYETEGAHTHHGYVANVGGKAGSGSVASLPPKKSITDLP